MADEFVEFNRHDLLRLRPDCEFTSAGEDRREIARWLAAGRPVIVRRPCFDHAGVHCGIPLPPDQGKGRLSFTIDPAAVTETISLPRLDQCLNLIPEPGKGQLQKVAALSPFVFGSLAWQHLTGLNYLREGSDIDLLFRVSGRRELERLLAALPQCDTARCDIEIMLWNGDAFSWGEWRRNADRILLKCRHGVRLEYRSELTCRPVGFRHIAAAAISALREELETYPKPGLVSYVDCGRHHDMNVDTFNASIHALPDYFLRIAEAGGRGAAMAELRELGIAAEARMLEATGGVNTHRGAIFSLGLLAAASGRRLATGERVDPGEIIKLNWSTDITRGYGQNRESHGCEVRRRFGIEGAAKEAASGFPAVFRFGLPAFRAAFNSGVGRNAARIQAFFAMLEHVADSTILYRGGVEAMAYAQLSAAEFNRKGGVAAANWRETARGIHHEFIRRGLSGGGVADLLAAVIFVHQMEELWQE